MPSYRFGKKHHASKIVLKINEKGFVLNEYESITEASKKNNVTQGCISKACITKNLKSKGFYFTSDELKYQVTSKNTNTSWDGEKVNFTIKNSQNLDLVTEYDITYTASCNVIGDSASYATCKMNGSETDNFSGILPTIQSCYNDTIDNVS